MGCLKLAYRTNDTALKVVHGKMEEIEIVAQKRIDMGLMGKRRVMKLMGMGMR